MEPKLIWQSRDGLVRITETYHEDENDGLDFTLLHVERQTGRASMGEPIWTLLETERTADHIIPEAALRELLVQTGLRTSEMD